MNLFESLAGASPAGSLPLGAFDGPPDGGALLRAPAPAHVPPDLWRPLTAGERQLVLELPNQPQPQPASPGADKAGGLLRLAGRGAVYGVISMPQETGGRALNIALAPGLRASRHEDEVLLKVQVQGESGQWRTAAMGEARDGKLYVSNPQQLREAYGQPLPEVVAQSPSALPEPVLKTESQESLKPDTGLSPKQQLAIASIHKVGDEVKDSSCQPDGRWVYNPTKGRSDSAMRYEEQITHMPAAIDYAVPRANGTLVRFDGCDVHRHVLQEAKGPGYQKLFEASARTAAKPDGSDFFQRQVRDGISDQAKRQAEAALGRPVEWSIAEKPAEETFRRLVEKGTEGAPGSGSNFRVEHVEPLLK